MNLYLISQYKNNGYDTYDSAVVAAESSDEAILIHPSGDYEWDKEKYEWKSPGSRWTDCTWIAPIFVDCKLIGIAHRSVPKGTALASFNAS